MTQKERDRLVALKKAKKLAAEYLAKKHAIQVSRETLRSWMTAARLWRPKRKRMQAVAAAVLLQQIADHRGFCVALNQQPIALRVISELGSHSHAFEAVHYFGPASG